MNYFANDNFYEIFTDKFANDVKMARTLSGFQPKNTFLPTLENSLLQWGRF